MMKSPILFFLLIAFVLFGCKSIEIEERIANQVKPIEDVDNHSFKELGDRLEHKDIIILGESGHGDGKTYEVKAQLVQYLMKEKGFNTIAFEGEGFIDLELKNNPREEFFPNADLSRWKPHWGNVVQTTGLVLDILHNDQLNWNYIGLEGYHRSIATHDFLYNELEKVDVDKTKINNFKDTYEKLLRYDEDGVTLEEIDFIINTITFIIDHTNDATSDGFVKQALLNIKGGIEDYKYSIVLGGYEDENRYVNIRDKRMAENVIWYKKNNPDAKIIVWIANFHGAKQVQKVRYGENDPNLYQQFKLFAEYLVDDFGSNNVYSIGFISSSGEVKDILVNSVLHQISTPPNSLEHYLDQKNIPFGYLDFNDLKRNKPKFKTAKFNSMLLGYDNKIGQWLDVFDGVFYIKKNEPLKMSEYYIW